MRTITSLSLAVVLAVALAAPAAAAKPKRIPLSTAKSKVLADFGKAYGDVGDHRATCKRKSARVATCTIVRTAGAGPCGGKGTARLTKTGRVKASTYPLTDCTGIPGAGVTIPVDPAAPPSAPAPGAPGAPVGAPAGPAPAQLSGTFVCLTGIIAQVRPAGPASIEPIPVPASGIEPPLKFTLKPDGTYSNITFGAAYANDPKWQGTYTVAGDRVRLLTPNGTPLVSYDFVRRQDTAGTHYLIEDAPANEAYKANVCRAIA